MAAGDSFLGLRQYLKGKIDRWELVDSDKSISEVIPHRENRGLSRLRLNLGDNGAFKMLGLSDDDIWFYNNVTGPYSNHEFETMDSVKDNFFNGYSPIWHYMDSDNLDTMEEISKYVYPKIFDINDEKFTQQFAKRLNSMFEHEIRDIIRDYVLEKNAEMGRVAERTMDKDLEEASERSGIEHIDSDTVEITVAELLNLYMQWNLTHLPIKELLKTVMSEDSRIGGWFENEYEYQDDDEFDKDSFNRQVTRSLDKILEYIEDDNKDWAEYRNLVDDVTRKFHYDHWYPIPKTDNYLFLIDGFDKETRKIEIKIRNTDNTKRKSIKLSLDNFNNLLYQPELFKFEDLYNL